VLRRCFFRFVYPLPMLKNMINAWALRFADRMFFDRSDKKEK
jgi:hypothetical protein